MKIPILKLLIFTLFAGLLGFLPQAGFTQAADGTYTLYVGDGAFIRMDRPGNRSIYLVVNDDRYSAIATQSYDATGWIISESDSCFVRWNCGVSSATDQYKIPFGDSTRTNYLPFSFQADVGGGDLADVCVATWGTTYVTPVTLSERNNQPWPLDVPSPQADPTGRMVTDVIDRWWRISWVGPTSNGGWPKLQMIDFYYQGAENTLDSPQEDYLAPQCWDVASYEWTLPFGDGVLYTPSNVWESSYYYNPLPSITIDPLSSIWVLSRVTKPLDVGLLFFNAQCDAGNVSIDWSTASETNNESFTVQRSENGTSFTDLGVLPGAGNSNTVQNYHFTDFHPLAGIAYYRLKQKDLSGQINYSAIVQANCNDSQDSEIHVFTYYDPKDQTVSVALNGYSGPATVVMHDMVGRQLTQRTMSDLNPVKLDVGFMRTGIYFVVVRTEFKTITTKILISRQQ